jgi:hypothetical protein
MFEQGIRLPMMGNVQPLTIISDTKKTTKFRIKKNNKGNHQ